MNYIDGLFYRCGYCGSVYQAQVVAIGSEGIVALSPEVRQLFDSSMSTRDKCVGENCGRTLKSLVPISFYAYPDYYWENMTYDYYYLLSESSFSYLRKRNCKQAIDEFVAKYAHSTLDVALMVQAMTSRGVQTAVTLIKHYGNLPGSVKCFSDHPEINARIYGTGNEQD